MARFEHAEQAADVKTNSSKTKLSKFSRKRGKDFFHHPDLKSAKIVLLVLLGGMPTFLVYRPASAALINRGLQGLSSLSGAAGTEATSSARFLPSFPPSPGAGRPKVMKLHGSKPPPPDFTVLDDDDCDGKERKAPRNGGDLGDLPPNLSFEGVKKISKRSQDRTKDGSVSVGGKRGRAGGEAGTWSSSWMDKNRQRRGDHSEDFSDRSKTARGERDRQSQSSADDRPRSFREDFRGTRVFVQGLPDNVEWRQLKDHFGIAGEVVFASVSVDPNTGESKGCGVVQFETTDMARNAIQIMRNHPLDGEILYVREDYQEKRERDYSGARTGGGGGLRGDRLATRWRCANEDNVGEMSEEERDAVINLIKARDAARRRKNYDVSDAIREELKTKFSVHVDDRLKLWWNSVDGGRTVPETISDIKGGGRWGALKPWRQIPTTVENDACVDPDLINGLLKQRDVARREKDFETADALLEEARTAPEGDLCLRIHDESRTWRIWTEAPPPRPVRHADGQKSAADQCLDLVSEHDPEKVAEIEILLEKFPGREWNILKKLKKRYLEK